MADKYDAMALAWRNEYHPRDRGVDPLAALLRRVADEARADGANEERTLHSTRLRLDKSDRLALVERAENICLNADAPGSLAHRLAAAIRALSAEGPTA